MICRQRIFFLIGTLETQGAGEQNARADSRQEGRHKVNKFDERFQKYCDFCERIENIYRAVVEEQDKNYEAMDIAEGAGDDETLDSLNEYAQALTEKLQKLLNLRSQASKIFDAVEFMRDIGLEF